MFIDKTYFINRIALPDSVAINEQLPFYIERYEEELLIKLLGRVLYADLVTNKTATSGKWYDFINGCSYDVTCNDETFSVKWIGLKNTSKRSMLANFVFCKILQDNKNIVTGVGVIQPSAENGTIAGLNEKVATAWNEMVNIYGTSTDNELIETAYAFLRYSSNTFDDWYFTEIEKVNVYGL